MNNTNKSQPNTKRIENAVTSFQSGNSCSQAILSTYAGEMGIEHEVALKLASGFGGGMGRQGHTCGAVTGAMMVIGLKHGFIDPDDSIGKEDIYELIRKLTGKMEERFHTTVCNELVGYNIAAAEGYQAAKKADVFNQLCPGFVRVAAEILEELL